MRLEVSSYTAFVTLCRKILYTLWRQHPIMEEIVLKRAHAKLELTNTVIEGGQVCVCVLACVVWWWEGGG